MAIDYAARARALVGARFRPQGRGEGGFDCVGVVTETFGIAPAHVRRDYEMRGPGNLKQLRSTLNRHFRKVSGPQIRVGDVMLLEVAEGQPHLAVRTEAGFVHAHAGIRRVVETPGLPEWPLIALYRKRRRG